MISWNRFYDPETGRYISADPIGLWGGMNLYAYVKGDPVNLMDLMGLACELIIDHDYREKTGRVKTEYSEDSNPIYDLLCSHPDAICMEFRYQYKKVSEQLAVFGAVIEVCTDDCGLFLSQKVISKKRKKGSECWVLYEKWRRVILYTNGIPDVDPGSIYYPRVNDD